MTVRGAKAWAMVVAGVALLAMVGQAARDPGEDGPLLVGYRRGYRVNARAECISSDGNTFAFVAQAATRIQGERRRYRFESVFVRDGRTGVIERVSVNSDGQPGNSRSSLGGMSDDGRRVLFSSLSDNLDSCNSNRGVDVYLRDRDLAATWRVSVSPVGVELAGSSYCPTARCLSADGQVAVFRSVAYVVAGGTAQIYMVEDAGNPHPLLVSRTPEGVPGNESSAWPSVSGSGRFVAFASSATDLVAGDTNAAADVFVYDRVDGSVRRASLADDGSEANGPSWVATVSDDGLVAFNSQATNLVQGYEGPGPGLFLHDLGSGATRRILRDETVPWFYPSISRDGKVVAFYSGVDGLVPEDSNGATDVFAFDVGSGKFRLLSMGPDGTVGDGDSWFVTGGPYPVDVGDFVGGGNLSFDGTWCVFDTLATNLGGSFNSKWGMAGYRVRVATE